VHEAYIHLMWARSPYMVLAGVLNLLAASPDADKLVKGACVDGDPGRHDGPRRARTLISWDRLVLCELVED
jgi:hypothetical protein